MVNVTCEKCGSQHSLEDASVPPSGKVMKCPSCAHPITVMPPDATAMGLGGGSSRATPPRKPTVAGLGAAGLPPQIPGKKGLLGGPSLAAFDSDEPKRPDDKFVGGGSALADVPAPRRASPLAGARGQARDSYSPLQGISAPSAVAPPSALSAADGGEDIVDLPTPKRASDDIVDLPAPKRASDDIVDLPTPKRASDDIVDLPTPVLGKGGSHADLPVPVGPTPTKGGLDLPAPKGFFDDLPGPKTGPAQPKATQMGLGDGPPSNLPAPKGFFDDIPAPKTTPTVASPPADGGLDLPAPKGFFDDIPAPVAPKAPGAAPRSGATGVLDLDDLDLEPSQMAPLPGPPGSPTAAGVGPAAVGMAAGQQGGLDLEAAGGANPFDIQPLELGDAAEPAAPAPAVPLELPDPAPSTANGGEFSDMDLPSLAAPSAGPGDGDGLVTFSASPKAASAPAAPKAPSRMGPPGEDNLELALDADGPPARPKAGSPPPSDVVAHVEPLSEEEAAEQEEEAKKKAKKAVSPKRKRIMTAAVAIAVVVGGGGFYGYTKWSASQERAAKVKSSLALARKHINSDRWLKAADAARQVLAHDSEHDDGLGLAAQAYYAAALDRGVGAPALIAKGENQYELVAKAAATGPEVDKAKGLRALTERQPAVALKVLSKVAKGQPNDGTAQLYLAWAFTASGDNAKALNAYSVAIKRNPKRVPALYGMGMAHLALGQTKEARTAFLSLLELDKGHIGAQVGVAQIIEVDRFNDRENRYLEILQRSDLDKLDPRAVSRAWSLAGDEALRASRDDVALARYAKALELSPNNIGAQVGEGKVAVRQGRYDDAVERLQVALQQQANNVGALIAFAEASYKLKKFKEAEASLEAAITFAPDNWRIYLVYGEMLQADEGADIAEAEGAYRRAMKLADKSEIAPTVALSKLLVAQGRGQEALTVLEPIETAAEEDAPLAVTLGVAYLGTGDAVRAEQWFRKALARRPGDTEAQLQLGLALHAQERTEEAIALLKSNYETNDGREDVGIRLALIYESEAMDVEAEATYGKLMETPGVSINVRARAGRFYARTGKIDKAVTLGESILAENNRNAAGHFLRGEGLYHQGDFVAAQKEYRDAVIIDATAQYYEGLGRSQEALKAFDDARTSYDKSIGLDGKYVRPRVGLGRIKLARNEYSDALSELTIARELDATDAQVHFYIGECYYETDRARDAAKSYSASLKIDATVAYTHHRLGMAYMDLDKARDACGAFKRSTDIAEGTEVKWLPESYRLLGYSCRHGNRALAIAGFRAFLDMTKAGNPEAKDVKKLLLRLEAGGK